MGKFLKEVCNGFALPSPLAATTNRPGMSFSLPNVGSLPDVQGDSAWMPNSAACALLGCAQGNYALTTCSCGKTADKNNNNTDEGDHCPTTTCVDSVLWSYLVAELTPLIKFDTWSFDHGQTKHPTRGVKRQPTRKQSSDAKGSPRASRIDHSRR